MSGRNQLLAVARPQPTFFIVLRIRDLRLVHFMVEPIVMGDQIRQFLELRAEVTLGQLVCGNVEKSCAISGHALTYTCSDVRSNGPLAATVPAPRWIAGI